MIRFTVRQIRDLLGLNQTDMAALLGMSKHAYANKEIGKSSWTTTEAEKFINISGYKWEQIKFS